MKITKNFKDGLFKAKADGFKRIYRIAGSFKATTYCTFHDIDELLNDPIGTDYGCAAPWKQKGMWTNHPNTRQVNHSTDIMFSKVFD